MLRKGNTIAFVSPSSWIGSDDLKKSVDWFSKKGIHIVFGKHIYDADGYAAGSAKDRANDINKAFADTKIKAIFCTRGGAGSLKILPYLDYDMIKKNKKPLFGLSDSTALQNALYTKTGLVSYTGFLPIYDFKESTLNPKLEASLNSVFKEKNFSFHDFEVITNGEAEGFLIGGCLSVFCSLCGTPYFPDLKDKILLLEDVSEKTYRLDLMLAQLKMQKGFEDIKGIIFGAFTNCVPADVGDEQVEDVIKKFAEGLSVPVIYKFPYGHIKERVVMPIGQKILIKTKQLSIEQID